MNDNDIVTSVTPKNTTITLQPIPEQLLTVKDVAKLLKCNVATVHKLLRAGVIRFLKHINAGYLPSCNFWKTTTERT